MLIMWQQESFASSPTALLDKWTHQPILSSAPSFAFVLTILTTSGSLAGITQDL